MGLQLAGGLGDALAAHPEHVGDQLLGHHQLVGRQPVEAQQQPAAKLLVHRVMPITDGSLGHLRDQSLRETQQRMLQSGASLELLLEERRLEPIAKTRALNDRADRHRFATHEKRNTHHALVAGDGNLGGGAISQDIENRNDAVGGEVDIALHASRPVQHGPERQGYSFEGRGECIALFCRQAGEKPVGPETRYHSPSIARDHPPILRRGARYCLEPRLDDARPRARSQR